MLCQWLQAITPLLEYMCWPTRALSSTQCNAARYGLEYATQVGHHHRHARPQTSQCLCQFCAAKVCQLQTARPCSRLNRHWHDLADTAAVAAKRRQHLMSHAQTPRNNHQQRRQHSLACGHIIHAGAGAHNREPHRRIWFWPTRPCLAEASGVA